VDREAAASVIPRGVFTYHPMLAAEGRGIHLTDVEGRTFLDFASGIGVTALGHSHPEVVAAIKAQADRLTHSCQHVMMPELNYQLCQKLADIVPIPGPKKVFLANSGAEAVENAVKIAKVATGRRAVVAFDNAFHGRTSFALALTGKVRPYSAGMGPLSAGVFHAPAPYCYRCPRRRADSPCCTLDRGSGLRRLFDTQVAPEEVAAIIVEPIQGEGGFVVPPPGWLRDVESLCREHGIVFIVDEIQTGLGRTGRRWAFEHEGVVPDLVCTAKALANGMPLSAVIGKAEIMDAPEPGALGGTYGGNPIVEAAALAVLRVMDEQRLPDRAAMLGDLLAERLEELRRRVPQIGDVRGRGLMQAIEMVDSTDGATPLPDLVKATIAEAREEGLLLISAGLHGNVIRFLPPLVIEQDELLDGVERLERALDRTAAAAS
jgi:4-aminobutyrate aminotransferase/(S)-3-amino-2-methylpropionate transaminase